MNLQSMYFAALLISEPPVYSGKYRSRGTYTTPSVLAQRRDINVCLWKFVAEYIDLVHEQDYRGSQEPT